MFGVIVCPKCGRARGVDLSHSKVLCPSCGGTIKVKKSRVYYRTDSESDLADGVRRMSERLASIDSPEPVKRKRRRRLGTHESIAAGAKRLKGSEDRLRFVAESLTTELGEFGREDLALVLKSMGEGDAERVADDMLAQGIMFEPRPGRYRKA